MIKKIALIVVMSVLLASCATIPMASKEESNKAKEFNLPSDDHAGFYIYRKKTLAGAALKKDVWIDEKCIGETAQGVFFFEEIAGNKDITVSTESEFSPNNLVINAENGKNYFIEQYIKMGLFVGGANLKQVNEDEGKKEIQKIEMATKGSCSK